MDILIFNGYFFKCVFRGNLRRFEKSQSKVPKVFTILSDHPVGGTVAQWIDDCSIKQKILRGLEFDSRQNSKKFHCG